MSGHPDLLGTAIAVHRHPRASRAAVLAFQDRALRRLVAHAYERVPYYRALFDREGVHPRDIRGVGDLDRLPLTSKTEMRQRPEADRIAAGHRVEDLLRVRTSGSSGEPFTIRRTWLEDKVWYLFRLRAFRAFGIGPRDRLGQVGLTNRPYAGDPKYLGRALASLGLFRRHPVNGLADAEQVLRELTRARPSVLAGLSGMLDHLTGPELATLRAGVRPRLIVVGGEVATPAMRERIRQAFGAPVFETYASHEFPFMAWSCGPGADLHVSDDGVVLELLHDGRPAKPGERGEIVVTGLHSYAMPFIRYRLGDLATRGTGCACGGPFSTMAAIQGRMLDYFPLPDGRLLHPYEIVTRLVSGGPSDWIRRYQLVQERRDRIVLRVVGSVPPPADCVAALVASVRPLIGPDVEFSVELTDDIPLTAGGKLRPSRSLVHSEYDAVSWAAAGAAGG